MNKPRPLLALLIAALLLVPSPAASFMGDFTIRDEIEAGRKFDLMVRNRLPMVEDPEVLDYARSIVERLARNIPPQPFPFKTSVVRNNAMNAFAVPGGYVYIFTGLFLNLTNEDQVAAVLAHELAHVTEHHVAKRMQDMRLASIASIVGMLGGALLGIAGGGANSAALGQAAMFGSQAGAMAAYLQYTQENEREADHQGLNYLMASGYSAKAMPQTFEIMLRQRWHSTNDKLPSYLSTHPALQERIGYLNDRIKRLPPDQVRPPLPAPNFLRIQNLVRAKFTDSDVALAYYTNKPVQEYTYVENMGLGILLTRLNRPGDADRAFQKSLAAGGERDPLVQREYGILAFKQGDYPKASVLFQKALALKPGDLMTLFYNSRLLAETGQNDAALKAMQQVQKAVPRDWEVRYHMGRLLGATGDYFGAHLNLAWSALLQNDRKQASFHMEKAKGLARTEEQKKSLEELETYRNELESM